MRIFRQTGGADLDASEALARAAAAMIDGDRLTATAALRAAADKSSGNCDFAPGRWLIAEADRLAPELPRDPPPV